MRAPRFRNIPVALASLIAISVLSPAGVRAHDDGSYDDDSYYDDNGGYYDESYDGNGWVTDYDEARIAGIPYYDSLQGYGAWRYVPAFGTHLWFPWVDVSWQPYYYGHWVRSSFGMTWVSHEPWGDVPFHYGRWVFIERFGWGWVPGWEYSPAWVTWSVSDGYVGWAPCAPAGYRYPRYNRYTSGVRASWYGYPGYYDYDRSGLSFSFWVFVDNRDFCGQPVYRHALGRGNMLSLWKNKRVLPVGPRLSVDYVQKVSPEKIRTVQMDRMKRNVGGRELEVYQPRGQKEYVRSGVDVARKSYVKPAPGERVPSRAIVKERVTSSRSTDQRVANPERTKVQSRPAPTKRVETGKSKSDTPARVDNGKPKSDAKAPPPAKVKQAETRDSGRAKPAEKPKEAPKSKTKSQGSSDKSGRKGK